MKLDVTKNAVKIYANDKDFLEVVPVNFSDRVVFHVYASSSEYILKGQGQTLSKQAFTGIQLVRVKKRSEMYNEIRTRNEEIGILQAKIKKLKKELNKNAQNEGKN